MPVAYQRLVHLAEDRAILAENAELFLITALPQVRVGAVAISLQFTERQFFDFAVHLEFEEITICD